MPNQSKWQVRKLTSIGSESAVSTRILSKSLHHVSPQVAKEMLNQTTGDRLRHKIWDNMTHDNVSYYTESFSDTDYGTTHLAVLAPNGDAVSVTTTINRR